MRNRGSDRDRRRFPARGLAPRPNRPRYPLFVRTLLAFGLLISVAGGVVFIALVLRVLASVAASTEQPLITTPLASVPVIRDMVMPSVGGRAPRDARQPDPLPEWNGQERITILLLGIDARADQWNTPTRSDTIMLLTIDPRTKRAGLVSIARDLWVTIPGYGENKINAANFLGDLDGAGNGPELARETIEHNFGVRVNYVARVDFSGFEQLIDAIDGVTIDVERPIKDDEYPDDSYGVIRLYIPAGVQHMDGATALRYARSRHADNDFERGRRQQQVLLAAREQALQLRNVPRLPRLIGLVNNSVETDIPVTEFLPLAGLARSISPDQIVSRSIDSRHVVDVHGDGTMLVPIPEKVHEVIDEVFADAPAAPTATARPSAPVAAPAAPAVPRSALVQMLNGTDQDGYGMATANWLFRQGWRITSIGQADRFDYQRTIIFDLHGKRDDAQKLADLLQVPATAIQSSHPDWADTDADFVVVLGFDARPPTQLR